ncbi:MAG: efflux RND transporter periplasmic adaptor subunit [Proteobacteria bacterium]|nr:efflux RND transporter periplasmic adaptor subunit [Pseudomonadota bacterium]
MDSPEPGPPSAAAAPARRARWIGSVIAVLALVALGWLAWHLTHRPPERAGGNYPAGAPAGGPRGPGGPGGGPRGAPPSTVGVATAHQADIPVILEALGTVTPVATVTVQPQVSGILTQVLFKEGQLVKKGDVLATIDPRPFQMALDQARGARLRDEAQLEAAKVTLERYRTLLSQDSVARQDFDTQAALVKQLEGTVTIDRANEATAQLNLGYTRIVAPVPGRVGLRPVDGGNYVTPGITNGIALITQIMPIDVEFALPQDRVPDIQSRQAQGADLQVTAYDRSRTKRLAAGSFSTLDNTIDLQTGTVKAKAHFANAEGLLFPNQFVNARLLLRTIAGAVVVPVTALRHGPNGDFVYVVNADHTVSLRNVTRGEATVDNVIVASGLELGEEVVTEGGDRLKDGARVQLAADRPARGASGAASGAASGGRGGRHRASDAASAASR